MCDRRQWCELRLLSISGRPRQWAPDGNWKHQRRRWRDCRDQSGLRLAVGGATRLPERQHRPAARTANARELAPAYRRLWLVFPEMVLTFFSLICAEVLSRVREMAGKNKGHGKCRARRSSLNGQLGWRPADGFPMPATFEIWI